MLLYLAQQQVPLLPNLYVKACVCATAMTNLFLSLRAALPDRTPHEVVLDVVSLAFIDARISHDLKIYRELTCLFFFKRRCLN